MTPVEEALLNLIIGIEMGWDLSGLIAVAKQALRDAGHIV